MVDCILGPCGIFLCGEVGKKKKNPVALGTGNHNHSNMVANLNLLEMFMVLGDFRQTPGGCNALYIVQSHADKYSV